MESNENAEQMNFVLNHLDEIRSSWISANEKLRDANDKIKSLEAVLSSIKNQLYKTAYQRDILNYALNQLYSTLRTDCKLIDQVRKNLSSYVRIADEQSSFSVPIKENITQNNSISVITLEETNASNSAEQFNQASPSILNNNNSTLRSNKKKFGANCAKKLGTFRSVISTRKTWNPPNASNQVTLLSRRNQNGAAKMFCDASPKVNETVTPIVNNKRRFQKLSSVVSNTFTRDQNETDDSNEKMCEIIVIDYNEEADETCSVSEMKTSNFTERRDVGQENGNNGLNLTGSAFPSSESDHQENEDNDSCSKEPTDVLASQIEREDDSLNSSKLVNLDSIAANVGDGSDNFSISNVSSLICSNPNEKDNLDFTIHTQNEDNFSASNTQTSILPMPTLQLSPPFVLLSPISESNTATENNVQHFVHKKPQQNENVKTTREKKKFEENAKTKKIVGEPKKFKKSLRSSPSISKLHSENTPSLRSCIMASKFSIRISKKCLEQKEKRTFSCKFCNEIFFNSRKLSQHLNRVHPDDEGIWTCQVCGFVTQTSESLAAHISHFCYKKGNGICVICEKANPTGISYIAKSVLDLHILNNHPNPYPDYLRCPYGNGKCMQHFTSLVAYDKHVKIIHKNEDLSLSIENIFPGQEYWTCAICKKIFFRSAHLMRHAYQAHAGNRQVFGCDLCKFVTVHAKRLQTHLKSHGLNNDNQKKKK